MTDVLEKIQLLLVGNATRRDSYWSLRIWLLRSLGFIYLVAFSILFFQGKALWGAHGLLPIGDYASAVEQHFGGTGAAFWNLPSLFYFFDPVSLDSVLRWLPGIGLGLAAALFLGCANLPLLLALWLVQLSYVNSGQLFYGYGWETQLLEFTFLCFFLVPLRGWRLSKTRLPPARVAVWTIRWMLFRLMLGAGLIKIRGDACWRDLTCLVYHYETQPNPSPLSFFYHHMPAWFHMGGALFNHFIELVVPFGYFGPARVRRWAGALTIVFQCILISSGNLSWLNWLTLVMCLSCFDDEFLRSRAFAEPEKTRGRSQLWILSGFALATLALSIEPALNLLSPSQAMNTSYSPWHLVNSYGAFGSVGKERDEVIISGTDDPIVSEKTQWKEYGFHCAPGDVTQRPCLITPYHYHLDWQIWFSAMRPQLEEEWLFRLAVRLLEADPDVTGLFADVPFPVNHPPRFIKMDLYRYSFADWNQWPRAWWKREKIGEYMPPISLDTPLARSFRK